MKQSEIDFIQKHAENELKHSPESINAKDKLLLCLEIKRLLRFVNNVTDQIINKVNTKEAK